MSIATLKLAVQGVLSATTTTTLYTVPASTKFLIKTIVLCNTDTVERTVTMQCGSGTGVSNRFLSAVPLDPGETKIIDFPGGVIVEAGNSISGGASVASVVSAIVSGVEVA